VGNRDGWSSGSPPFRTGVLSGGWKQRLAFDCAILHEPPIIFLDEPTRDGSGQPAPFWDLDLRTLRQRGSTTFVTTHYMDEAEYCNRIGLIYRGELIAIGSPDTLQDRVHAGGSTGGSLRAAQDAMGEIEKLRGIQEVALFGKACTSSHRTREGYKRYSGTCWVNG